MFLLLMLFMLCSQLCTSATSTWQPSETEGSRHVSHISLIHSEPAAICQVLLRKLEQFFCIFMELSFAL